MPRPREENGPDVAKKFKNMSNSVPIRWVLLSRIDFDQVYELTRQVPKGKVTTYAAIADALNRPRSARVIGFVMSVCPYSEKDVPCHRVIRSDGTLGGYGIDGMRRKAELLSREGITIENGKIDLARFLFIDFSTNEGDERSLSKLTKRLATQSDSRKLRAFSQQSLVVLLSTFLSTKLDSPKVLSGAFLQFHL